MKKTINKVKQKKDNYYKPTPSKMRKIGDAIQDIGMVVGSLVAVTSNPWIGRI